jgi:hypothetical protein
MYPSAATRDSVKERAGFILLAILVGVFGWFTHSSASRSSLQQAAGNRQTAVPDAPRVRHPKCPDCGGPPAPQEIYIPLIDLPEAASSELVFNSRSPQAMVVTPTFYKRNGAAIVCDPVTVESAEIRYVDIKQLLPEAHRHNREWGGFSLSYNGFNREIWAQLRFMAVNGGSNVDEFFTVKQESKADQLQAVWWMPEKTDAILALGNITDEPTSAKVDFGNERERTIHIAPRATKLLRYRTDVGGNLQSTRITVTGAAGSIVPTGLITSDNGQFNSVVRFYNPKGAVQSSLFANGFRVSGVTSHLVLKNTTSSPIAVVSKFIPVAGAQKALSLPQTVLAPDSVTEVDLTPLLAASKKRVDLQVVSVEISNLAAPGSVIGALYGTDDATGVDYDIPLRDSGLVRTMTGSYPWKISDDFTTVVYITNISDQQAEFFGEINYQGGRVLVDPRELAPGESAVFDLRELRENGFTDKSGHHLSADVSLGQFKWSVKGVTNGKLLLIGRAEMVSRNQSVSTSYSCNDPCPPFIGGSIDPFLPPIVIVNATANASAWETAYYGNGYQSGPYSVGADWAVETNAASVDPTFQEHTTTMSGEGPGDDCVNADMGAEQSYGWDGLNCYDNYNTYPVGDRTCTQVVDVRIMRNGSNITDSTTNVIVGQQITLTAQAVGTQEALSNIQWNVPGTRVANFAGSSSSGTVTQVNQQSNPFTFYWVDGAEDREVTLGCRIGTQQFSKSTTFDVKRPTGDITATTDGTVGVGIESGVFSLHYGSVSGTPGIAFSRTLSVPSGFSGNTQWVQLVTATTRIRTTNGAVQQTLSGSGLDTLYPYASGSSTEDSPRSIFGPCDFSAFSINDSFTMWLMFQPGGTGSIWVPLREVSWNWAGSAGRITTCGWLLTGSSHSNNPADQDSTTFPQWTTNITSFTFQ